MMTKTLLLAAAALMMSGGVPGQAAPVPGSDAKLKVLYNQDLDDDGSAVVSQMFETTYAAYDSQAADDFNVPKGATWTIEEVDAVGRYFEGAGPATSENVFFYKASKKKGVRAFLMEFSAVVGTDTDGSFAIKLPKGGMMLGAGHYFVSVQANMASTNGEWGWENTTTAQQFGSPAEWQNPGGGWQTPCATWKVETDCVFDGEGPDHLFELLGTSQ